jgi:hypothetical protein
VTFANAGAHPSDHHSPRSTVEKREHSMRMARYVLLAAVLLLLPACGGNRQAEATPGVMVIVLDPISPSALAGASMPFEVTVRQHDGRSLGNYSLSHANDPLVLLVKPGAYRVVVSAGCAGGVSVPPRGSPTHGNEAHVLVSMYPGGTCRVR